MKLDKSTDLKIFQKAAICRSFEEEVFRNLENKNIKIPVYLSAGQEYIAATFATFFEKYFPSIKKQIFIQHRGHATYISFGGDLKKKWEAFGWKTLSINGHNYFQILKSLTIAKESKRPCAIIANTVKGKGIKFMEDDNNWHYRVPNRDELKIIKKMLNV